MNFKILFVLAISFSALSAQSASAYCTGEDYLRQRPDVQAAGMNPRTHWEKFGRNEGMCEPYMYACDDESYLNRRPDVRAAGMSAAIHYDNWGRFEGMYQPFSTFHRYKCETTILAGKVYQIATYPGNPYGRGLNAGEFFNSNGTIFYCP